MRELCLRPPLSPDPLLAQPGTAAVAEALATLLDGWDGGGGGGSGEPLTAEELERCLRAAWLTPFADFGTVRSRFSLGGCAIDADVVRRAPYRRFARTCRVPAPYAYCLCTACARHAHGMRTASCARHHAHCRRPSATLWWRLR